MAWSFISDVNAVESWYIIPAKGDAGPGFKNFFDLTKEGGGPNAFVQCLPAEALKPDTEYLLWFKLHGPDPVGAAMAINLLPKGIVRNEGADLAKVVALEDGLHEFQSWHE